MPWKSLICTKNCLEIETSLGIKNNVLNFRTEQDYDNLFILSGKRDVWQLRCLLIFKIARTTYSAR